MNKMIQADTSIFTRELLRHGGEYRKGYLNALMRLDLIRVCSRCGRLFYPDQGRRSVCGKRGCKDHSTKKEQWHDTYHRSAKFSTIVSKLQSRAEHGDKDSERMLRNFLNSYALCDTKEEREDLIYMWLAEYPSLQYGKRGKPFER